MNELLIYIHISKMLSSAKVISHFFNTLGLVFDLVILNNNSSALYIRKSTCKHVKNKGLDFILNTLCLERASRVFLYGNVNENDTTWLIPDGYNHETEVYFFSNPPQVLVESLLTGTFHTCFEAASDFQKEQYKLRHYIRGTLKFNAVNGLIGHKALFYGNGSCVLSFEQFIPCVSCHGNEKSTDISNIQEFKELLCKNSTTFEHNNIMESAKILHVIDLKKRNKLIKYLLELF